MKTQYVTGFVMFFIACAWAARMAGGRNEVDNFDEPSVKNAVNFAVNRHKLGRNDKFRSDLEKVVKIQSQVVSGMKYYITTNMTRTNCSKAMAADGCGATDEHYQCDFTVWSRPWIPDIQLLEEKCSENVTSI